MHCERTWHRRSLHRCSKTQECMLYELASSIEIKDLGPNCNRRHVRHSLPESGDEKRGIEGGGVLLTAFLYVNLTCGKACLGGGAAAATTLFMCVLKGLYLRHVSLSHQVWWVFIVSSCSNCDDLHGAIKERVKAPVCCVRCHACCMNVKIEKPLRSLMSFWMRRVVLGSFCPF